MLRSLWQRATRKFHKTGKQSADDAAAVAGRARALQTGAVFLAMREIIVLLMVELRAAGKFDDDAAARLKLIAVAMIKNFETGGVPIEEETAPFREAMKDIEEIVDFAVAKMRKHDEI